MFSSRRSTMHRLILFAATFLLLPFSFQCIKSPLEPKAPTWQTQLTIPLMDKTYYFADIVNKDPKFDTSGGTILYNPITDDLGYKDGLPPDVFKMPSPRGNTIDQQIGAIPVDIGAPPSFDLTASDLGIASANFNPSFPPQTVSLSPSQLGLPTGVVLPADFPSVPIDEDFGDTTQFTYIIFANGTISLQITNNFPFTIQFSGNQLRLVNFNTVNDTAETVAQFVFAGPIGSNSSATSTPVSLAGVKMNGILKLKGTMSTSGATGQTLQSTDNITAQVTFASTQIQSMVPDPAPPMELNEVFGDSTGFQFIVFETGTMSLTITNNFPFTIGFAGNTLLLVNKNDTTQTVAQFVFPGTIAGNTTVTSTAVPLANVRMDALLKLKGTVNISNYFGTTVGGTDNINAVLNLNNGYLKSASINSLNFTPTSVLEVPDSAVQLDDSIMVKLARFDSGAVKIRIINNNAVRLSVKFVIDELRDNLNNGQAFRLNGTDPVTGILTINAHDSVVQTIQMENVTFVSRDLQGADTVATKFLHFSLEIKTVQADAGYALINNTDNVIADVQPTGSFVLSEVQGKIPPQNIDINQVFDAGIGDIGNNLSLTGFRSAINLSLNVLSTGLFPSDVDLDIIPVNKVGFEGAPVNISRRINPGDPSTIVIDSSNVNFLTNSFLAASGELPSKFIVRGHITISPFDVYTDNSNANAGVGRVVTDDSVFVSMAYAIPVAIGIQNGSLKDTASFAENNIDTTQLGLIESGKIFMNIENTFPVTIEVLMKLLRADAGNPDRPDTVSLPVLTLPQDPSDPVNYPPIKVSADTTSARTGVKSFTFINLIPSDAAKLGDASFTALDLRMMTAGNGLTAQQFNKTDKVRIKTFANVIFNVDFDQLDN
ncbi:MAG: hypothetical protein ACYC09_10725 [Bacteroidota bacterium]